jgi:hypothetical protein
MDTNTPTDLNEPLPLGGPLHPPVPVPPSEPAVSLPEPPIPPAPQPQVFTPTSPQPPAPGPNPMGLPPAPSNVIMPTQAPLGGPAPLPPDSPLPPLPPAPPAPLPTNPQVVSSMPIAPVVVSGSFSPNTPMPPGSQVDSAPNSAFGGPSAPLAPPASSKKRWFKPLLIGSAALLLLIGGSAAAYFAVIVPNQPANVLKTAVLNSIQQNSVSYNGNVSLGYQATAKGVTPQSYQLTLSGSKNGTEKASEATIGFEGYGVKLNLQERLVDQNIYLKTGDLSTVAALVGSFEPSLATTATTISKDVSDQWVEIDSSLLNSAGVGCYLNNANVAISQADLNLLSSDYAKHEFVNITSTANDTVNGQAAEKFVVNIDDDKAASFVSGLGQLSTLKSLETCNKDASASVANSLKQLKGDNQQTALSLWVSNADKRVVEVAYTDSARDVAQTHVKGTVVVQLNYGNVSIAAPANAESVLKLYTQLQPTLSGLDSSGLNLTNPFGGATGHIGSAAASFLK